MDLVSICIPTYNGERYLKECLDSAIGQTYTEIEIIVADDQSKDSTYKIVEEYCRKDNRIKLFKNEVNLGLVGNWNRCIDLATGQWIKFLFQDDLLDVNAVKRMMEFSDKADIISCNRSFLFEEGVNSQTKNEYEFDLTSPEDEFHLKGPAYITPEEMSAKIAEKNTSNFIGEPTAVLFKKSLIKEYGPFNKDLVQLCDLEFWYRIATHKGLFHIPERLAYFRVHKNSTTSGNKSSRLELVDSAMMLCDLLHHESYSAFRNHLPSSAKQRLELMTRLRVYEIKSLIKKHDNIKLKDLFATALKKKPALSHYTGYSFMPDIIFRLLPIRRKIIGMLKQVKYSKST